MFVGHENHGARGATSRQGMVPDGRGAFVRTHAPLPGQIYPGETTPPQRGGEYPKMLFAAGYCEAQKLWRETTIEHGTEKRDVATRDRATQDMRRLSIIVHGPDEEEEAILDGYRANPVDHLVEAGGADPRVPVGAEARRSSAQKRESLEDEITTLRRELALKISQRNAGSAVTQVLTAPEPIAFHETAITLEVPAIRRTVAKRTPPKKHKKPAAAPVVTDDVTV